MNHVLRLAHWISHAPFPSPKTLGYHAEVTRRGDEPKWVQVDLGKSLPIDSIRLIPMSHDGKPGFGFPIRFRVEASDDKTFQNSVILTDHHKDIPNPGANPV